MTRPISSTTTTTWVRLGAAVVGIMLIFQQSPSSTCFAFQPTTTVLERKNSHPARIRNAPYGLKSSNSNSNGSSPSSSPAAFLATAEQEHARAQRVFSSFDRDDSGTISAQELTEMLTVLEIQATEEEAQALFQYLDTDKDGVIGIEEFLPWYNEAAQSANQVAASFQSLLIGRRTVDHFDETPVNDDVLRRAVECAIAAPNRSMSEPWRFLQLGPQTVQRLVKLKRQLHKNMETDDGQSSIVDWTRIPGWCVVTTKRSPDQPDVELEDFRSTACAIQNFMLSMWSEGIGTKWTSGPVQKTEEFAKLCGIDTAQETVVGCIWFGFPTGGLVAADPKRRKKTVDDVLSRLP